MEQTHPFRGTKVGKCIEAMISCFDTSIPDTNEGKPVQWLTSIDLSCEIERWGRCYALTNNGEKVRIVIRITVKGRIWPRID